MIDIGGCQPESLGPITFHTKCSPPCQFAWYRNGEYFVPGNVLLIENPTAENDGIYLCKAWNSLGNSTSDQIDISIASSKT